MTKVFIKSLTLSGTDKKGSAVFVAIGLLNDDIPFEAMTIQWKGEPIFKVFEGGFNLKLAESSFSRGERIAIARECKAARIKKFGEGHKITVKPELNTGEMVTLKASSRAADRRQVRLRSNSKRHSSGLPMHASISALKRVQ